MPMQPGASLASSFVKYSSPSDIGFRYIFFFLILQLNSTQSITQLTPILEKIVLQLNGHFILAKVDVDKQQAIAQSLGIRSVPTVFGVFRQEIIDSFSGYAGEQPVVQFVQKLLAFAQKNQHLQPQQQQQQQQQPQKLTPDQMMVVAKQHLEIGDVRNASKYYSAIIDSKEATDLLKGKAFAGLALVSLADNKLDIAQQVVDMLKENFGKNIDVMKAPEVTAALAKVLLAKEGSEKADKISQLLENVRNNPQDFQSKYDLAEAYFVSGKQPEAIEMALSIVKSDRTWNDSAAKKLLFKFFEALGATNPLTIQARKRLATYLF